jgi:AraC family transcriptional regulator
VALAVAGQQSHDYSLQFTITHGAPMIADLSDYSVFNCLHGLGVPVRAAARLGGGMAAALWEREDTGPTCYDDPGHHTLSLYVAGGEHIRRQRGTQVLDSHGAGSLCLMPAGVSSEWEVGGTVNLFHLYIPRAAFDRVVVETLDMDPGRVSLRDESFFRDSTIEAVIRNAVLPLQWDEPAEKLAVGHAGQMLMAYLAARFAERGRAGLAVKGGLSPAVRRRIDAYIEAHLHETVDLESLASEAGLSPYHFARMFKHSTGESPHAQLLRRRVEKARTMIDAGKIGLADIAAACGFSSQSHFTARFRQQVGLTPGQYADAAGRRLVA